MNIYSPTHIKCEEGFSPWSEAFQKIENFSKKKKKNFPKPAPAWLDSRVTNKQQSNSTVPVPQIRTVMTPAQLPLKFPAFMILPRVGFVGFFLVSKHL